MKTHYIFIFLLGLITVSCKNTDKKNIDTENSIPKVNINAKDTITSPLILKINANESWSAFEGQLGNVSLIDENSKALATGIISSSNGDWMTNRNAQFETTLNFNSDTEQKATLVFKNYVISEAEGDVKKSFEIPVILSASNLADTNHNEDGSTSLYFASEAEVKGYEEDAFSYQIYRFNIAKNNEVKGLIINAPYGNNGSKGSFTGTYDPSQNLIIGKETSLAKGKLYTTDKKFSVKDNAITLITETRTETLLPKVSKNKFGHIYNAYRNQNLFYDINTTDDTRVKELATSKKWGFDLEELDNLVFKEVLIDLDGNYKNKTYLVYIISNNFCGSGGCHLFLINENADVLSSTTVVRLPVYTKNKMVSTSSNSEVNEKDLIVWSDGAYRVLKYENKKFTSNASMGTTLSNQDIIFHPEKYTMILDY